MTKKNSEKKTAPAKPVQPESTPTPTSSGPVVTTAMLELMRSAANVDAAVAVLAPPTRTRVDATYAVNANVTDPLPARRGVGLRVLAVAVRLDRPFTVADITNALPDAKGARYWVGKLAKSGHFVVAE